MQQANGMRRVPRAAANEKETFAGMNITAIGRQEKGIRREAMVFWLWNRYYIYWTVHQGL